MKCAVHTDREAAGGCCSCGKYVCPECKVIIDGQIYCNQCLGDRMKSGSWPAPSVSSNTSGQGPLSKLPAELHGWNWGAFLLTWIWGIGNNVWIALISLCGLLPYIGWIVSIVMAIVLGVRGNEWAWQKKQWDSVEHFKKAQRSWMWWGVGILALQVLLFIAIGVFVFSLIMIAVTSGLGSDFNWESIFPTT